MRARAAEQPGQRGLLVFGCQRPAAHLDRGFRHVMATDVFFEEVVDVAMIDGMSDQPGRDPVLQRVPGGIDGFRAVIGMLAGHTLRPGLHTCGVAKVKEQDPSFADDTRRNAKRLPQWKPYLAKLDLSEIDHSTKLW